MTAYDFNLKFKTGDVLSVGRYCILLDSLRPGHFRQDLNAIVYYAIEDMFYDIDVYTIPRPGIGYIEEYDDEYVKLVDNKKKRSLYEAIASKGYKWDSEHKRLVPTITE